MIKTILFAKQLPIHHQALGPVFEVTFKDNTTTNMYAETFFDQIPEWRPDQILEGWIIDLDKAFIY